MTNRINSNVMKKVSEYNLKTKLLNFFKLDIIQELILAGIGC